MPDTPGRVDLALDGAALETLRGLGMSKLTTEQVAGIPVTGVEVLAAGSLTLRLDLVTGKQLDVTVRTEPPTGP